MKKRVVITGMGVVSSLGIGVEKFWDSIKEGKVGITAVTRFDASNMSTKVAAEVNDFDPAQFIDKKEAKKIIKIEEKPKKPKKPRIEKDLLYWLRKITKGLE
ncbi:MAG: hypothetical protein K6T16_01575 [Candidatus Pacearchaeota archaeon]|nr:hypothetical protein [Candidatus Pacearchaeota archaeon]